MALSERTDVPFVNPLGIVAMCLKVFDVGGLWTREVPQAHSFLQFDKRLVDLGQILLKRRNGRARRGRGRRGRSTRRVKGKPLANVHVQGILLFVERQTPRQRSVGLRAIVRRHHANGTVHKQAGHQHREGAPPHQACQRPAQTTRAVLGRWRDRSQHFQQHVHQSTPQWPQDGVPPYVFAPLAVVVDVGVQRVHGCIQGI